MITPTPTSKSLQDDLWFSLEKEALHDLAQYPELQPPPTAPVPLLPVQLAILAKAGSKEEPISVRQDLFFLFVIPFCKKKRSHYCGRKQPLLAAKPLMRGSSSLPSHGEPSSHSLCLPREQQGQGSQPIMGYLPHGKTCPCHFRAVSSLLNPLLVEKDM